MSLTVEQLQGMMTGTQEGRVEALRQILDYPLKQRDPEGSRFWFLRPGVDEDEAEDTCPIAVGFYSELDGLTNDDIKQFLTADEQQREIYGHYTGRIIPNQPVMYLLLPEGDRLERVAMILPTDGKLRQRQIQTFSWAHEKFRARLNRLKQDTLIRTERIKEGPLSFIPLVEWAFYEPITTAKELAQKLAEVSRRIEGVIPDVYRAEPNDGYLRGLLRSFQKELLPTLKLEPENEKDYSFADIYAQTIAYGLFTARVFSYTIDERRRRDEADPARKETDFNREDAWKLLPETNPFLRRLFRDVSKAVGEYDRGAASDESPVIADELIDAIAEVISILRAAKMDAILEDFRAKMNREDIVIRFYEDFLAAYKPQMRERRGVYYTPEPVVSYMVRSVDILLKEKLNKPLGLADPEVMILDPACGTGTFLLWIFQEIYRKFQENPELLTVGLEDQSWSGYVKERLLPRIFGFELLMAPYAIAHLKLGLFLEETEYQFDSGKRLGVYLTNTLDDTIKKSEILFEEFVAEEADQALEIKRNKPVMVIIGNPPYSNFGGMNKGKWILNMMKDWKPDNEKKWNPDDLMKFMRWSQWRIEKTGQGILAFITNHTYINGLTHRRMRQSLVNIFSDIHVFDLHGNSMRKEISKDKSDENVFDIRQGVSIGLLTKIPGCKESRVFHSDLWGRREEKYEFLFQQKIDSTKWTEISPSGDNFFFIPQESDQENQEYIFFDSITDIFSGYVSGIQTGRDDFVSKASNQEFSDWLDFLADADLNDLQELPSWSGFDFAALKVKIKNAENRSLLQARWLYRPFDVRPIIFDDSCIKRARGNIMSSLRKENLCLITVRQLANKNWQHILVTQEMGDGNSISINTREYNYYFPLYIYPNESPETKQLELQKGFGLNISPAFLEKVSNSLNYNPSSESIFYYIYAVLHSPTYRTRYAEFLKIDFPRIPLTSNDNLFRQLSIYGERLADLHLMKDSKLNTLITQFEGTFNPIVDAGHPKYLNGKVIINKKGDGFTGVSEEVWNFYVGGYQVCHKWLKDRKGRTLTQEDIIHYQRIIVALQETIRLMQQIDEAIPGFPLP